MTELSCERLCSKRKFDGMSFTFANEWNRGCEIMLKSEEIENDAVFKIGDKVTVSIIKLLADKFELNDKTFTIIGIGKYSWLVGECPYILDTGCSMKFFTTNQLRKA